MPGIMKPVYEGVRPGDIKHSQADISLARACHYEPKYSLEEGLRETAESYRSQAPGHDSKRAG